MSKKLHSHGELPERIRVVEHGHPYLSYGTVLTWKPRSGRYASVLGKTVTLEFVAENWKTCFGFVDVSKDQMEMKF